MCLPGDSFIEIVETEVDNVGIEGCQVDHEVANVGLQECHSANPRLPRAKHVCLSAKGRLTSKLGL